MDTEAVLALLQDVAARVINPRFRALGEGQVKEKNPGDLVTVADREAEVLIAQALQAAYPQAVILGEEAHSADPSLTDRYAAADHAFTIDPVDGTKNFVHGSPDHAVMVGEVTGGQVVRGWIWLPQYETGYVAERGAGAWRVNQAGRERLHRPAPADHDRLRGVTSRRKWIGRQVDGLPPLELTWVCCGMDYPRLAEGAADYILYGGAQPWDHVPGSLLLTEAGGFLGTLAGAAYAPQEPKPDGLIAAADRQTFDRVISAWPPGDIAAPTGARTPAG